jgi:hypothetical protein
VGLSKPPSVWYQQSDFFLKAADESNRANIMALRYAVSILEDFINLSPDGRKMMADTLMDLISQKKENVRR